MIKKMLPWVIIVLVAITLITVTVFVLWKFVVEDKLADPAQQAQNIVKDEAPQKLSADKVSKLTVKIDEITTNLADIDYMVRISFAFQLSNAKAKDEFEALDHIARAAIIKLLADTNPEDIQGSSGHDRLISRLMNELNPQLQRGNIMKIDITEFIISYL